MNAKKKGSDGVDTEQSAPPEESQQHSRSPAGPTTSPIPPPTPWYGERRPAPFCEVVRKGRRGRQVPDGMGDGDNSNTDQEQRSISGDTPITREPTAANRKTSGKKQTPMAPQNDRRPRHRAGQSSPAAKSRADITPAAPTLFRPKAICISGRATAKLCMIQWNVACPDARPGIISRREAVSSVTALSRAMFPSP